MGGCSSVQVPTAWDVAESVRAHPKGCCLLARARRYRRIRVRQRRDRPFFFIRSEDRPPRKVLKSFTFLIIVVRDIVPPA